jgi:hypothetical protein
MDSGRKSVDPLLSLERIEENCGCRGRNADWREWVFPGEGKGAGKPFRLAYRDLARARGEMPPDDPHPGMFFRRGVDGAVRSGEDAERSFFSSFGFLVDFFAQPDNAQELGGVLRQFLSRYCGAEVLSGLSKESKSELSRAEDALMKSCGDGHAHTTDTLRLLYNGAMATLLGNGVGSKIGAVHLGDGGRKLTPIGTPPALAAALDREERAVRGGVFCVDSRSGRCYGRGGWTESEWTEAVARVEAESGGSAAAKRAGLRALDSHYFPEKVAGCIAMRANLVSELRDDAMVHCRQGTTFSAVRLAVRLGGVAEDDRTGRGQGMSRGTRKVDALEFHGDIEAEFADVDESRYLPAPSSFEEMMPDDAGIEALETASARGEGEKASSEVAGGRGGGGSGTGGPEVDGAGAKAKAKRRRTSKLDEEGPGARAGKQARKFLRNRGGGNEVEEARLKEIFLHGDIGPGDYDSSRGCFVAASTGDPGSDPSAWRRRAGEAQDQTEAVKLAEGVLRRSSSRAAGVAIPCEDGVVLLGRAPDGIRARRVEGAEFDREARVSRGRIAYDGGSYIAVGNIQRVPFGEGMRAKEGDSRIEAGALARGGLSRGGVSSILGALKRAFRGGR